MKPFISIIIILFLGCSSTKTIDNNTELTKDRLVVKTKLQKDTTVHVSSDSTSMSLRLDDLNKLSTNYDSLVFSPIYFKQSGRAKVSLVVKRDTVKVIAQCDSVAIRVKIKKELEQQFNNSIYNKSTKSNKKSGYSSFTLLMYCIASLGIGIVIGLIKNLIP